MAVPRRAPLPTAIVFDCKGAAEGAISVVRTLGRAGVPVVVLGDDLRTPTARSRYCEEFLHVPAFTSRPEEALAVVHRFAATQPVPPVLFPTADPDLLFVSRWQHQLEPACSTFVARPEIIAAFSDKRRFIDFAQEHGFPVPATFAPADGAEVRQVATQVRYPVVLKPSHPAAWTDAAVQRLVHHRKALVLESRDELVAAYDAIAPHSNEVIVQEWIPGADDAHYSLHVYVDRRSRPLAVFTGRKVRVYPAYAGSGCFVRSVRVEAMIETGLAMLQRVRYTGIAVINFKHDARSGRFLVHEINPRISQWNILPTRCGVDIPWIAYADAAGLDPEPAGAQSERWQYVYLRNDLKAFATYRRDGEWSTARYVRSLLAQPRVHQLFATDDPGPLVAGYAAAVRSRLAAVFGRRGAPAPAPQRIVVPVVPETLAPVPLTASAADVAAEPALAAVASGSEANDAVSFTRAPKG
jgi:predicted ATP-grasp superfamily ATP-dependent carboligase